MVTDKITNKLDELQEVLNTTKRWITREECLALINVARASHIFFTRWVEVFPTIEPNGVIDNLNKELEKLGEL